MVTAAINENVELVNAVGAFPFNKTFDANFKLGGSSINSKFDASLFAGTNFDCHEQTFNYEGLAQASTDFHIFGWSKQAFLAEAVYGKENGQIVGDQILVKVWDNVVYQKKLPSLDCKEHIQPITHVQKGISVSYTIWISIVPVTFSAGVDVAFELDWGWRVCDSDLSVMVELIPKVTFSVNGAAEIDLLIIRAGLELSGSINGQLRPQGYASGANCSIGIDLREVTQPMAINFDSFYTWRECKILWIFDCHWGNHNTHTWFKWSSKPIDNVIFSKAWDIKV